VVSPELVDDPWQTFDCDGQVDGCETTFADPEFAASGRDALSYARVFESPIPTVHGSPLNCEYGEEGRCVDVQPCDLLGECLNPDEPRTWSSPIWVDHPAARRSR